MMAQAKRIYILIIKVNKLFSFPCCGVSKRNSWRKHVLRSLMKVWENLKKLWKHSPVACIPTAFLILQNFQLCFYNSIAGTRFLFLKQCTNQILCEKKTLHPKFFFLKVEPWQGCSPDWQFLSHLQAEISSLVAILFAMGLNYNMIILTGLLRNRASTCSKFLDGQRGPKGPCMYM